ncbi:MAG TPA: patatin family protein [Bacillales bacterium]|nr:patatin family protein [Bacillales bacterium]
MKNIGLVLEGGGMRGVYTAGVLEFFLEHNVFFPYNIGVSSGAGIASSYLSRQKGRNKKVNIDFARHPGYISFRNWLFRRRGLFGMDLIFDKIPNHYVPFDFKAFTEANERFVVGTTDCLTGQPIYYEKSNYDGKDFLTVLRASSSLPFMAPIVEFEGKPLLDGGITDPMPLKKSEADGNDRNVLILTRTNGYLRSKLRLRWFLSRKYPAYEGLIEAMDKRFHVYNETTAYIEQQEEKGNAFVIRPSLEPKISRIERNPTKLSGLYRHGYKDAEKLFPRLKEWLGM